MAAALGYVPISTIFIPIIGCRERALSKSDALELLRRLASVITIRADVMLMLESSILEVSR